MNIKPNSQKSLLYKTVIKNGFCIGCGVCCTVKDSNLKILFNKFGMYQAAPFNDNTASVKVDEVCIFSDKSKSETQISETVFNSKCKKHNSILGFYNNLYFAHVKDDKKRVESSSGGVLTLLVEELLNRGEINGVIHPRFSPNKNTYYNYQISYNAKELNQGKKSYYYPVEVSGVLEKIKADKSGKKYAIVGVPCFITNLRLLSMNNEHINSKLKYYIGINCGHLKTSKFGEYIAQQYNINASNIVKIDFRNKLKNKSAGQYGMKIFYNENNVEKCISTKPAKEHKGYDWGMGFFKYKACDYCDDIFAETSDIVFGDAWTDYYRKDWKGTNIIVCRNKQLNEILNESKQNNDIELKCAESSEIIKSQDASNRHRREGLKVRLYLNKNKWKPTKRVDPNLGKNIELIKKQKARTNIREKSNKYYYLAMQLKFLPLFNLLMILPKLKYFNANKGLSSILTYLKKIKR